jgi:hypothetical protein
MLAACAGPRARGDIPADAEPVASVRPAPGPQPLTWRARDELPDDAVVGNDVRALLLEVTLRDGAVHTVETAPLELANLIVRVVSSDVRRSSISLDSTLDRALKLELFVSPDGQRFRAVSSCPIIANGSAYEMFAEPVAAMAVARIRVADENRMACE